VPERVVGAPFELDQNSVRLPDRLDVPVERARRGRGDLADPVGDGVEADFGGAVAGFGHFEATVLPRRAADRGQLDPATRLPQRRPTRITLTRIGLTTGRGDDQIRRIPHGLHREIGRMQPIRHHSVAVRP